MQWSAGRGATGQGFMHLYSMLRILGFRVIPKQNGGIRIFGGTGLWGDSKIFYGTGRRGKLLRNSMNMHEAANSGIQPTLCSEFWDSGPQTRKLPRNSTNMHEAANSGIQPISGSGHAPVRHAANCVHDMHSFTFHAGSEFGNSAQAGRGRLIGLGDITSTLRHQQTQKATAEFHKHARSSEFWDSAQVGRGRPC